MLWDISRIEQLPLQWVPGSFSPRLKRSEHEADYSPPSSAEVRNVWGLHLHSHIRFHGTWCLVKHMMYPWQGTSLSTGTTFTLLYRQSRLTYVVMQLTCVHQVATMNISCGNDYPCYGCCGFPQYSRNILPSLSKITVHDHFAHIIWLGNLCNWYVIVK